MREVIQLFISSIYITQLVEMKTVSNFAVTDLGGLCVFGAVQSLPIQLSKTTDCSAERCQVPVSIKDIKLRKSSSKNFFLYLFLNPEGQTLHTLTHVYLTLRYPNNLESLFLVSFWNLNGFHEELLQRIQIGIPFDESKLQIESNESVYLEVQSRCSCGNFFSFREFHLGDIRRWNDTSEENQCFIEHQKTSAQKDLAILVLATMGLCATFVAWGLFVIRRKKNLFYIQSGVGAHENIFSFSSRSTT